MKLNWIKFDLPGAWLFFSIDAFILVVLYRAIPVSGTSCNSVTCDDREKYCLSILQ